jgi:tetratricopeptide (TPR) repeat protein
MGLEDPLGVLSYFLLSGDDLTPFTVGARRNTDDRPLLEFNAPRNLFRDTWNLNVDVLREYRSGVLPSTLTGEARERAYVAVLGPLIERGEMDEAAQALRELAGIEAVSDVGLMVATARVNLATGRLAEAGEALTLADRAAGAGSEWAADRAELWSLLSEASGNGFAAIGHAARAAALAPDRFSYLERLAALYAQEGQWADAAEWMSVFIETRPFSESLYWELLGEYLVSAGEEDRAVAAFEAAMELEPYSYLAPMRLAEVYERRGDAGAAAALLEPLTVYAVDRDPNLYTRLISLYETLGRWDDALRVAEKGRRIFPADAAIYRLHRSLEVGEGRTAGVGAE